MSDVESAMTMENTRRTNRRLLRKFCRPWWARPFTWLLLVVFPSVIALRVAMNPYAASSLRKRLSHADGLHITFEGLDLHMSPPIAVLHDVRISGDDGSRARVPRVELHLDSWIRAFTERVERVRIRISQPRIEIAPLADLSRVPARIRSIRAFEGVDVEVLEIDGGRVSMPGPPFGAEGISIEDIDARFRDLRVTQAIILVGSIDAEGAVAGGSLSFRRERRSDGASEPSDDGFVMDFQDRSSSLAVRIRGREPASKDGQLEGIGQARWTGIDLPVNAATNLLERLARLRPEDASPLVEVAPLSTVGSREVTLRSVPSQETSGMVVGTVLLDGLSQTLLMTAFPPPESGEATETTGENGEPTQEEAQEEAPSTGGSPDADTPADL